MIRSTDQLGRTIELKEKPKKIISLVPSISELIWDLGLENEIAGITKFCIHPDEMFKSKTRIGGTKNLNVELIQQINPDLIIGNKEENTKEQIEFLENHFPVWMSDVNTFEESIEMIREVGKITGKESKSKEIISDILSKRKPVTKTQKVIYFIWHEPDYVAGKNTFIDSMLHEAGFENCIQEKRYPEITKELNLNPDYIFLSTEPFPFTENHFPYFQDMFPKSKIRLVNGEMFSWYGSGMIKAYDYFKELRNTLN